MKTKICFVLNAFAIGGAETVALDLARRLDPVHFEVTVLATHDPNHSGTSPMRLRFQEYGVKTVAWNLGPMRNPLSLIKLWKFFRQNRFTIVHGHNRPSDAWAVVAARWAGVPCRYWTRHLVYQDMSQRQINRYAKLSAKVHKVIAVSDAVKQSCIDVEHISAQQVQTITNGIDLHKYSPLEPKKRQAIRQQLNLADDEFMLLFVGRMNEQKAPTAFPALIWQLREMGLPVRGFMGGTGPLQDSIERLVAGGSEGITMLGFRNDIPELLGACDLFVSTSRNEGLPLNVMEAMACGTAFAGPDILQISCLLEGNPPLAQCLYSAPPAQGAVPDNQIRDWAGTVAQLLSDATKRTEFGRLGRDIITEHYSLDRMVSDYQALYRKCPKRQINSQGN